MSSKQPASSSSSTPLPAHQRDDFSSPSPANYLQEGNWTTDQLTRNQIKQLQNVLEVTREELFIQQRLAQSWEQENKKLMDKLLAYQLKEKITELKQKFQNRYSLTPENPFLLLSDILNELPKLRGFNSILSCFVKSGDSWIGLSSSAFKEEEIRFQYKAFDNFVRFRSVPGQNLILYEDLSEMLPPVILDYISSGNLPELTAESLTYDEAKLLATPSPVPKTDLSTKKGIIFKSRIDEDCRCIFIILTDPLQDGLLSARSQQVVGGEFLQSMEEYLSLLQDFGNLENAPLAIHWSEIFEDLVQLMILSTIKLFEIKRNEEFFFQADLKRKVEAALHVKPELLGPEKWQDVANLIEGSVLSEIEHSLLSQEEELHGKSPRNASNYIKVHCDFLLTSHELLSAVSDSLLMINKDKQLRFFPKNGPHLQETNPMAFFSGEEACNASVLSAVLTERPKLKCFSKLSSQSIQQPKLLPSSQSHSGKSRANSIDEASLVNPNNRSIVVENFLYLTIPLLPVDYEHNLTGVVREGESSEEEGERSRGVILITIQVDTDLSINNHENILYRSFLSKNIVPVSFALQLNQGIIHKIAFALAYQNGISHLLLEWIEQTNYSAVNIFSSQQENDQVVRRRLAGHSKEKDILNYFTDLLHQTTMNYYSEQTYFGDDDRDDDSLSFESMSINSDPQRFYNDDLDSQNQQQHHHDHSQQFLSLIQYLRDLFQADWSMILQIPSSSVKDPEVILTNNFGNNRKFKYHQLSHNVRHDLMNFQEFQVDDFIHDPAMPSLGSNSSGAPDDADGRTSIEKFWKLFYHEDLSCTLKDYYALLEMDENNSLQLQHLYENLKKNSSLVRRFQQIYGMKIIIPSLIPSSPLNQRGDAVHRQDHHVYIVFGRFFREKLSFSLDRAQTTSLQRENQKKSAKSLAHGNSTLSRVLAANPYQENMLLISNILRQSINQMSLKIYENEIVRQNQQLIHQNENILLINSFIYDLDTSVAGSLLGKTLSLNAMDSIHQLRKNFYQYVSEFIRKFFYLNTSRQSDGGKSFELEGIDQIDLIIRETNVNRRKSSADDLLLTGGDLLGQQKSVSFAAGGGMLGGKSLAQDNHLEWILLENEWDWVPTNSEQYQSYMKRMKSMYKAQKRKESLQRQGQSSRHGGSVATESARRLFVENILIYDEYQATQQSNSRINQKDLNLNHLIMIRVYFTGVSFSKGSATGSISANQSIGSSSVGTGPAAPIEFLQSFPFSFSWIYPIQQSLSKYVVYFLYKSAENNHSSQASSSQHGVSFGLSPGSSGKDKGNLLEMKGKDEDVSFTNIALNTLSKEMLFNHHFMSNHHKSYYLHNYLYSSDLLQELYRFTPFKDFIILPIMRLNSQNFHHILNHILIEHSSDSEDSDHEQYGGRHSGRVGQQGLEDPTDEEFLYLLHMANNYETSELLPNEMKVNAFKNHLLHLPSKLSKFINAFHLFTEEIMQKQAKEGSSSSAMGGGGDEEDEDELKEEFIAFKPLSSSYAQQQSNIQMQRQRSAMEKLWKLHSSDSILTRMPEGYSKMVYQFMNNLDLQFQGKLSQLIFGNDNLKDWFPNCSLHDDMPSHHHSNDNFFESLFSSGSNIFLYSPFYPSSYDLDSYRMGRLSSQQSKERTLMNHWTTHYLIINKKDSLVSNHLLSMLKQRLDEIFLPSKVISSARQYFECISGMERLLMTATDDHKREEQQQGLQPLQGLQAPSVASMQQAPTPSSQPGSAGGRRRRQSLFSMASSSLANISLKDGAASSGLQVNTIRPAFSEDPVSVAVTELLPSSQLTVLKSKSIINETLLIIKSLLGNNYLASVAYLKDPNQNQLADSAIFTRSQQQLGLRRTELFRCYVDSTHAAQNWEIGPNKIVSPLDSSTIFQQFSTYYTVGSNNNGNAIHHRQNLYENASSIHLIEMTTAELNEYFVQNSQDYEGKSSAGGGGSSKAIGASGLLLRTDVKVLQIFFTSDLFLPTEANSGGTPNNNNNASFSGDFSDEENNNGQSSDNPDDDYVTASIIIYISVNPALAEGRSSSSSKKSKRKTTGLSSSSSSKENQIEKTLGKGLLNGLIRILEISNSLITHFYYQNILELYKEKVYARNMKKLMNKNNLYFDKISELFQILLSIEQLKDGDGHSSPSRKWTADNSKSPRGVTYQGGLRSNTSENELLEKTKTLLLLLKQNYLMYGSDNHGLSEKILALEEKNYLLSSEKNYYFHLFYAFFTVVRAIMPSAVHLPQFQALYQQHPGAGHDKKEKGGKEEPLIHLTPPADYEFALNDFLNIFAEITIQTFAFKKAVELLTKHDLFNEFMKVVFLISKESNIFLSALRSTSGSSLEPAPPMLITDDTRRSQLHDLRVALEKFFEWKDELFTMHHLQRRSSLASNSHNNNNHGDSSKEPPPVNPSMIDFSIVWNHEPAQGQHLPNSVALCDKSVLQSFILLPKKLQEALYHERIVVVDEKEIQYITHTSSSDAVEHELSSAETKQQQQKGGALDRSMSASRENTLQGNYVQARKQSKSKGSMAAVTQHHHRPSISQHSDDAAAELGREIDRVIYVPVKASYLYEKQTVDGRTTLTIVKRSNNKREPFSAVLQIIIFKHDPHVFLPFDYAALSLEEQFEVVGNLQFVLDMSRSVLSHLHHNLYSVTPHHLLTATPEGGLPPTPTASGGNQLALLPTAALYHSINSIFQTIAQAAASSAETAAGGKQSTNSSSFASNPRAIFNEELAFKLSKILEILYRGAASCFFVNSTSDHNEIIREFAKYNTSADGNNSGSFSGAGGYYSNLRSPSIGGSFSFGEPEEGGGAIKLSKSLTNLFPHLDRGNRKAQQTLKNSALLQTINQNILVMNTFERLWTQHVQSKEAVSLNFSTVSLLKSENFRSSHHHHHHHQQQQQSSGRSGGGDSSSSAHHISANEPISVFISSFPIHFHPDNPNEVIHLVVLVEVHRIPFVYEKQYLSFVQQMVQTLNDQRKQAHSLAQQRKELSKISLSLTELSEKLIGEQEFHSNLSRINSFIHEIFLSITSAASSGANAAGELPATTAEQNALVVAPSQKQRERQLIHALLTRRKDFESFFVHQREYFIKLFSFPLEPALLAVPFEEMTRLGQLFFSQQSAAHMAGGQTRRGPQATSPVEWTWQALRDELLEIALDRGATAEEEEELGAGNDGSAAQSVLNLPIVLLSRVIQRFKQLGVMLLSLLPPATAMANQAAMLGLSLGNHQQHGTSSFTPFSQMRGPAQEPSSSGGGRGGDDYQQLVACLSLFFRVIVVDDVTARGLDRHALIVPLLLSPLTAEVDAYRTLLTSLYLRRNSLAFDASTAAAGSFESSLLNALEFSFDSLEARDSFVMSLWEVSLSSSMTGGNNNNYPGGSSDFLDEGMGTGTGMGSRFISRSQSLEEQQQLQQQLARSMGGGRPPAHQPGKARRLSALFSSSTANIDSFVHTSTQHQQLVLVTLFDHLQQFFASSARQLQLSLLAKCRAFHLLYLQLLLRAHGLVQAVASFVSDGFAASLEALDTSAAGAGGPMPSFPPEKVLLLVLAQLGERLVCRNGPEELEVGLASAAVHFQVGEAAAGLLNSDWRAVRIKQIHRSSLEDPQPATAAAKGIRRRGSAAASSLKEPAASAEQPTAEKAPASARELRTLLENAQIEVGEGRSFDEAAWERITASAASGGVAVEFSAEDQSLRILVSNLVGLDSATSEEEEEGDGYPRGRRVSFVLELAVRCRDFYAAEDLLAVSSDHDDQAAGKGSAFFSCLERYFAQMGGQVSSGQLLAGTQRLLSSCLLLSQTERHYAGLFSAFTARRDFFEFVELLLTLSVTLFTSEGHSYKTIVQKFVQLLFSHFNHYLPAPTANPLPIHSIALLCLDDPLSAGSHHQHSLAQSQSRRGNGGGEVIIDEVFYDHHPMISPNPFTFSSTLPAAPPTQAQAHQDTLQLSKDEVMLFTPGNPASQRKDTASTAGGLLSPILPTRPRPSSFEEREEESGLYSIESSIDCYEIKGKMVVRFLDQPAAATAGRRSPSPTASPRRSRRAASPPSSRKPTTPTAEEVEEEEQRQQFLHEVKEKFEFVVPLLVRVFSRRLFELYRGQKNKLLMSQKKQELTMKSFELNEKTEQIHQLENYNNMTNQELTSMIKEKERIRLLLSSEQKQLKEKLSSQKEMNAQLKQSILDMKNEFEKKELLLVKELKSYKEMYNSLLNLKDKDKKDIAKLQQKEVALATSRNELTKQVSDLTRSKEELSAMIKQLQSEVSTLQAHEHSLIETNDTKLRSLLVKIKALEDELAAVRGTNVFLKKQLELSNKNLKTSQDDHLRQLNQLQASVNRSNQLSPLRFATSMNVMGSSNNNSPSPARRKQTVSPPTTSSSTTSRRYTQQTQRQYQQHQQQHQQQQRFWAEEEEGELQGDDMGGDGEQGEDQAIGEKTMTTTELMEERR